MTDAHRTEKNESMTPEQRKCDEDVGHDWNHFAYEPDTNAGGYMECKLCGFITSDDGFDVGSDFDDNYC